MVKQNDPCCKNVLLIQHTEFRFYWTLSVFIVVFAQKKVLRAFKGKLCFIGLNLQHTKPVKPCSDSQNILYWMF